MRTNNEWKNIIEESAKLLSDGIHDSIIKNIHVFKLMTGEEAARHIAGIIKSEGEPLN